MHIIHAFIARVFKDSKVVSLRLLKAELSFIVEDLYIVVAAAFQVKDLK